MHILLLSLNLIEGIKDFFEARNGKLGFQATPRG
jgi:hypothetical protein